MERHAFLRAELLTPGRLTAPEDQVFFDENLVNPNGRILLPDTDIDIYSMDGWKTTILSFWGPEG